MNKKLLIIIITIGLMFPLNALAQQENSKQDNLPTTKYRIPNPRTALLHSIILPGWGHRYVNKKKWTQGKIHLATEVVLWSGLLGVLLLSTSIDNNLASMAKSYAGANIKQQNRSYELAISTHNSIREYNEHTLRTRQWDRLYDETNPNFNWEWTTENKRIRFNQLRRRRNHLRDQIPTVIGLMVINRIISSIDSFILAQKKFKHKLSLKVDTRSQEKIGYFGLKWEF